MKSILIVLGSVAVSIVGTVFYGYVLSILWTWFIVPLFHGASSISIPLAIGLSIVVRMLTAQTTADKETKKSTSERLISGLAESIIYPLFALLFGYIVHLFV